LYGICLKINTFEINNPTQMATRIFITMILATVLYACTDTTRDRDNDRQQTIVNADSSGETGRLVIEVRRQNNNALVANARVNLFLSYDDLLRNISLYSLQTNNSGRADFGFVLNGNYYLTASATIDGVPLRDTTVAQIIPIREVTRILYLR
jgi:hypothetical protein